MTLDYNGGLTREQFLFYEARNVAGLSGQGYQPDEIIRRIQEENLFQFPTERMITSIARTCLKRLEALQSETLIDYLAHEPAEVAKQINLYAIMKENRLVWEFMTTVIGEKYRTQAFDFSLKDLNLFIFQLQEQSDTVASWSEATIKKIKQVLKRILVECGYLDSHKATKLNPIAICPELEEEIRALNDLAALPAFNCFR